VLFLGALGLACSDGSAPPPNVHVSTDLSQSFDCQARDCIAPYRRFPDSHPEFAVSHSDAEVADEIAEAESLPLPSRLDLSPQELRSEVIDALNIRFLLDGLDERPLEITVFDETQHPSYVERRLIFADPIVGEFEALELEPLGAARRPAIVGLHGHFDGPPVFASDYLGSALAEEGYLVLMPKFRAMDCFDPEAAVSVAMLKQGFTLMGLRVYETLLLDKYLRSLASVDAARIGLLTHSGGSSTANLVTLVSDRFRAHVSDYFTDWRDHCTEFPFASVHCETVPALFRLSANIDDESYRRTVTIKVPYAFAEESTRVMIREFFAQELGSP
jgi:dienelactone hydrolase